MKYFDRYDQIIHHLLSQRNITRYILTDCLEEGKTLPGGVDTLELSRLSGLVVTPEEVYPLWLDWVDGKQGYYTIDSELGSWVPINPQEEAQQEEILLAQQKLREDPKAGIHDIQWTGREPGKATRREHAIVDARLCKHEFTDYALVDVQSGGHDLIGSLYPGEVQDITAILVLPYEVCRLSLDWNWEQYRYTFGEEKGAFKTVRREECSAEVWSMVEEVQRPLREKVERETQEKWVAFEKEYWVLQEEAPDEEATHLFWEREGGSPQEKASRSVLDLPRLEEKRWSKRNERARRSAERRAKEGDRSPRPRILRQLP